MACQVTLTDNILYNCRVLSVHISLAKLNTFPSFFLLILVHTFKTLHYS
jgi:hypothetical protein